MITPSTQSPYSINDANTQKRNMITCLEGFDTTANYSIVKSAGPAARPLEFPTPTVHRACRKTCRALDHRTGRIYKLNNVLLHSGTKHPQEAYLIRKKIAKSIYGVVRICVVLKPRRKGEKNWELSEEDDRDVKWISTDRIVAIKISSWARMAQFHGRHLEDPIREISAMQLIGNYHPNLIGSIEVLQDDEYLFTVMPYCEGGDLTGRVINNENCVVGESRARMWFQQLLSGLSHLQKKGVCHRDISLENIMIDNHGNLVIIDLGMGLRVPYTDPSNIGCVTDVSEGSERRLMVAQGQGGDLMYMAPEVVDGDEEFDGFAVDLWGAGVVLFVLLVRMAPFKWAHDSDKRYLQIAKGNLKELLKAENVFLSPEACHLLQNMFWRDPRKRLTLAQVIQHPWLLGKQFSSQKSIKTSPQTHHHNIMR